jgi:hypothetical protein
VGFNMRKVTKGGVTIKMWDLGGQVKGEGRALDTALRSASVFAACGVAHTSACAAQHWHC